MNHLKKLYALGALILSCGVFFGYRTAQASHDHEYYDGTPPQSPKLFFDVNQTDPAMMRDYLGVINSTYDSLLNKGISASRIHLVLSLRGLTVTYATQTFGAGTANEQTGQQIRELLNTLMTKNAKIEACEISLQWMGVNPQDLLSGITVIDNAFIESTWYQSHGYAIIPLFQP